MAQRPINLDLSGAKNDFSKPQISPRNPFHLDLPSPRVGEIPPALSPLDAFAQQSRMLAKKFEESQQSGRRLSRLPHLELASELAKRPGYFRNMSGTSGETRQESGSESEREQLEPTSKLVATRDERPMSHYPRFSSIKTGAEESRPNTVVGDTWYDAEDDPKEDQNYFGIQVPRRTSPEPFEERRRTNDDVSPAPPSLTGSYDSIQSSQPRTNTDDSWTSQQQSLAPPKRPHHPRSNRSAVSIRSVIDSADEDADAGYDLAPPRKFSNSSGFSGPRSPLTPDVFPPGCRSPSAVSERSTASGHFQRPSFNFSRPLSSSGNKSITDGSRPSLSSRPSYESRPFFEFPARKTSIERSKSPLRQGSTSTDQSEEGTPKLQPIDGSDAAVFGADESLLSTQEQKQGAESYIYAKYSLPRGRMVERGSLGPRESWLKHQFTWEEAPLPTPPAESEEAIASLDKRTLHSANNSPNSSQRRSNGHAGSSPPTKQEMWRSHPTTPSMASESTDRTLRAHSRNSPSADIVNMSPEEHLEKGIECHGSGSLSKSTYHLRLAARAGLPTAMLLYALACRHGWGMRANQQEGVMWLKRAVESSSIELLSDDDVLAPQALNNAAVADPVEAKTRKVQFALAIYELGISYMNGWGIPKDKSLALRCFEIAGSWGDCDALAEAGFCYTQGIGCRKDMKKAAAFYRRAEAGGMSMAGNSW